VKALIWLRCLAVIYGIFLVILTVLNWKGAERFWPFGFNLYLPQVMWAVPGIILTFLIFKVDRFWTWLPLLCVLWVLGPIMDCRWSLHETEPLPDDLTVRVMTWNIKYDRRNITLLIDEIVHSNPDVVLFQDAGGSMRGPLGTYFKKWQVRSHGQYVIASRYPLSELEVHELPFSGNKEENFLRCRMNIGSAVVSLYNVHFKTPRQSLKAFKTTKRRPWDLPEVIQDFDRNVQIRIAQAATLKSCLLREAGPVIVAGDLNAPDASLVCATLRSAGMHDAFAEGGRGYGFTYGHLLLKNRIPWLRFSWMRIDHIMMNSRFLTKRCWTGTGKASDHRPVIADMILKIP